MFKLFAIAALASAAAAMTDAEKAEMMRGNGYDNLVATTLIDDALLLHIYNADNDGTDELHGELAWISTAASYRYREYGFCARAVINRGGDADASPPVEETYSSWDCMKILTDVDPASIDADPVNAQAFDIRDGYSTVGLAEYQNDA